MARPCTGSRATGSSGAVARHAHRWIPRARSRGIESRSVRIETQSPCRRVTRGAIALDVTPHACLQTLPGRLAMPKVESAERIVISRDAESAARDETSLLVAALAELRRVVTIAAICLA